MRPKTNSMPIRVLVFGTYDVLHPGHRDFFKQARELGDELRVIIARDQTVLQVKGREPQHNEAERLAAVQACQEVTQACLGHLGDKYAIIEELQPDIIALGYDQGHFADRLPEELTKRGLKAKIVRLKPYKPELYKSSLLQRVKK